MFTLSDNQILALKAAYAGLPGSSHPVADFYRLLADYGEGQSGVDDASMIWLRGAAEMNENSGSQSQFIRDYNKAQFLARYGDTLSDAEMDAISNKIGDLVYKQVLVGTANEAPLFSIPSIEDIADADAQPAAQALFKGNAGGGAGIPDALYGIAYDGGEQKGNRFFALECERTSPAKKKELYAD
ncbi:hypothetical protein [Aliiroseovarius lamellibrachiae]|uniref:hypothetical protein n=1 Tax=Aliiroseovarius lamellibrachiae TaxID=1924933 RepID=UPI001BE02D6B|nr:hypothetical protein [Aliiroseovarius lamellibrachiae]MBT2131542.1 hypothetical protein [Aliiroseovarius lamellibrachiae]